MAGVGSVRAFHAARRWFRSAGLHSQAKAIFTPKVPAFWLRAFRCIHPAGGVLVVSAVADNTRCVGLRSFITRADARGAYDAAKRAHGAATTPATKKTALDAMSKAANEIASYKSQLGHK